MYTKTKKTPIFNEVEAAHCVCLFLFDLIQYLFQFFITIKPKEEEAEEV